MEDRTTVWGWYDTSHAIYLTHESDNSVNHVHVLVPLHNLGSISHSMNEVLDCFRDTYTTHESDNSANHVHVLVPLHNLGSISHSMNEVHDCFRDTTGVNVSR